MFEFGHVRAHGSREARSKVSSKELTWFEKLNLKLESLIDVDSFSPASEMNLKLESLLDVDSFTPFMQQTTEYVETSVTNVGTNVSKLYGNLMRRGSMELPENGDTEVNSVENWQAPAPEEPLAEEMIIQSCYEEKKETNEELVIAKSAMVEFEGLGEDMSQDSKTVSFLSDNGTISQSVDGDNSVGLNILESTGTLVMENSMTEILETEIADTEDEIPEIEEEIPERVTSVALEQEEGSRMVTSNEEEVEGQALWYFAPSFSIKDVANTIGVVDNDFDWDWELL